MTGSSDWAQQLRAAGYRVTGSRGAIMRVLADTPVPLPPQQILESARSFHQRLGLVTVYRTLALLTELGLVHKVHCEEGCHGYVAASPGHRHLLVCTDCGRAVEFAGGNDLSGFVDRVERNTGYRVSSHLLQLFGLCPECCDATSDS
ncbi:MAG: transcriptional repressor [Chloroflexi bacterium]|nr:transcriptional repressor [Chloroflexota bacterium]